MNAVDPTIVGRYRAFYLMPGAKISSVIARVSYFSPNSASIGSKPFPVDPPFAVTEEGWHLVEVDREAETASVRRCSPHEVVEALASIKPSGHQIAEALEAGVSGA